MKTLIALLVLVSAASGAAAQEFQASPLRTDLDLRSGPRMPSAGEWEGSLDLFFRYSMITGSEGTGGKWSDDFSDGLGFRVGGTVEYHVSEPWSLGAFLSTGVDVFRGKNSGGVSLDDWVVVPILAGPVAKLYLGPALYAEGHAGAGVVRYGSVDASALGAKLPLFDESWAFAWEVGAHLGYKFNVDHGRGPTPQVALQVGVNYERWAAPKVDQTSLPGVSAKSVQNIAFDVGFWFGF